MEIKLTAAERRVIRKLQKLAAAWPPTLWLFSGDGQLYVMRTGENGEQVLVPLCSGQGMHEIGGGVDSSYIVAKIDIPNDGGAW
jgi:hypothetical protein